ncbi:uncharacterized protein LOC112495120 [Cephus cinctus]|uniref:Uncharacterized protein LOC112495120 n=1 Tax=Cephus cinctus TaxID=211228 RepID=A0AAJ7RRP1_CEPCN|nr:uncharacterized protein LOC112495120 [Cephus cinctus]
MERSNMNACLNELANIKIPATWANQNPVRLARLLANLKEAKEHGPEYVFLSDVDGKLYTLIPTYEVKEVKERTMPFASIGRGSGHHVSSESLIDPGNPGPK